MMYGYATLNGGTTGGAGGPTVTVTNAEEYIAAASDDDPRIVIISGTITGTGSFYMGSNKTVVGLPGSKIIGLGTYIFTKRNIIIRNLDISEVKQTPTGDDDIFNIKFNSENVWIDHCRLAAQLNNPDDHDGEMYDGLTDITRGSSYITISNSIYQEARKSLLITHDSDDPALAPPKVTIHNNIFRNNGERNPAVRRGNVHVFNNLFQDIGGDCVAYSQESLIRAERNYFNNCRYPILSRDDEDPNKLFPSIPLGSIAGIEDNIYKGSSPLMIFGPKTNWTPPYQYKNLLLPTEDIPSILPTTAGAILTESQLLDF